MARSRDDLDLDEWEVKDVMRANDGSFYFVMRPTSEDGEPGTAAWRMRPVLR